MDPTFGHVLRSVRQAQNLSLAQLAGLIHYSRALIAYVETGQRQPTDDFARAVDEALHARGLLVDLARVGDDETVYRRTLIQALGTFAGVGALAPAAVAEQLRRTLDQASGVDAESDWESIVLGYGRGFMVEPLPALARRAVGDLMVISANPATHGRHGVRIAMVYGSSVASLGDTVTARRWYGTAVALADNTADPDLRAWSRARLAYRTLYEGGTDQAVLQATELPIARGRASAALIEAHAARAHVHAARADRTSAYAALAAAYKALDATGEQDETSIFAMPSWRLAIAASWAYTALGDASQAEAAQVEARRLPATAARWATQIDMHEAWGLVLHDDIEAGATQALDLVTQEPSRVIRGLGQRVHAAVPIQERKRPAVRELAAALR